MRATLGNRVIADTREAPHNIEAEQHLLGAILINNAAFEKVSDFLDATHFFDPVHSQIYSVARELILTGKQASPVTLKTFFENANRIEENLTVPQYLGKLATVAIGITNAKHYGEMIRDLAVRREIVLLGEDMINSAYDAPIEFPTENQIREAEARLFQLSENQPGTLQEITFSVAVNEAMDRANEAFKTKGQTVGLSTGLIDLDRKLGGLQSSDLVIIAGRPSMGKTALATNIAWSIASKGRVNSDGEIVTAPVHFFSLEMSGDQLATRILAEQSGLSSERIRRGQINQDEFRRLSDASQRMCTTPLYIDQTGGISIAHLSQRARRMKRRHGTVAIVVDYLQLMTGAKRRDGNRVAEITEITTGLKALAKELSVPVIALSQLSREVEKRTDKRPQLSDLKESGSIEQDADVVMFVFREEYYLERQKPSDTDVSAIADWQSKVDKAKGKAEIIIGKQRHGPLGIVDVSFNPELTKFGNLALPQAGGAQ